MYNYYMKDEEDIYHRIIKHGSQSVIVTSSFLSQELKSKTIVEIRINIVNGNERAAIRNWDSGLSLNLNREPSFVSGGLGVRLQKFF